MTRLQRASVVHGFYHASTCSPCLCEATVVCDWFPWTPDMPQVRSSAPPQLFCNVCDIDGCSACLRAVRWEDTGCPRMNLASGKIHRMDRTEEEDNSVRFCSTKIKEVFKLSFRFLWVSWYPIEYVPRVSKIRCHHDACKSRKEYLVTDLDSEFGIFYKLPQEFVQGDKLTTGNPRMIRRTFGIVAGDKMPHNCLPRSKFLLLLKPALARLHSKIYMWVSLHP